MNRQLSIILPCYDPLNTDWAELIIENLAKISATVSDVQLILVNDGSTIDLNEGVKKIRNAIADFNFVSYSQNEGKGYAIRKGIEVATHPNIIFTDVDFPYTTASLVKIYDELEKGHAQLVVGIKDDRYYESMSGFRLWISKILRLMNRTFLNIKITDTQCGLKGFKTTAKDVWLSGRINRYLFDLEAIYKAEKMGLNVLPVQVSLRVGVKFSSVRMYLLAKELGNFLKIAFMKPRSMK